MRTSSDGSGEMNMGTAKTEGFILYNSFQAANGVRMRPGLFALY